MAKSLPRKVKVGLSLAMASQPLLYILARFWLSCISFVPAQPPKNISFSGSLFMNFYLAKSLPRKVKVGFSFALGSQLFKRKRENKKEQTWSFRHGRHKRHARDRRHSWQLCRLCHPAIQHHALNALIWVFFVSNFLGKTERVAVIGGGEVVDNGTRLKSKTHVKIRLIVEMRCRSWQSEMNAVQLTKH